MKRTMKKYISLLLAMLMLMSSVAFSIAAADHVHILEPNNPAYYKEFSPTCVDKGYTVYYCADSDCNEVVNIGNYKDALDHKYGEWAYVHISEVDESGVDGYYKYKACTRKLSGKSELCGERIYECTGDEKNVYFLVSFVNHVTTSKYAEDVSYTKVAVEFTDYTIYSTYVKKGESAAYKGELYPVRDKTKEFGQYSFVGWSTEKLDATRADNLSEEDTVSLVNVQQNLTLYPVFTGISVYYDVVFHSLKGQITVPQKVLHGSTPSFRVNGDASNDYYAEPPKDSDIVNDYVFNGWAANNINQSSGIPTAPDAEKGIAGIEETPVYDYVHYYPTYAAIPKGYTVEFYDYTEENLIQYAEGKYATFDNVNLMTNLYDSDKYGAEFTTAISDITRNSKVTEKPSNKEYYYTFTGKWRVLRSDDKYGSTVSLSNLYIGEGDFFEVTDEETGVTSKIIRLVPVYEQRLRLYAVDIQMGSLGDEDEYYYRGEAVVQVTDKNGQLVASGKTDEYGMFRCYLNYKPTFTVTVATQDSKYLGTAYITDLLKATESEDVEASLNKCYVPMQVNPEYISHCSCIHHNALIQPIFVRILNILYSFFNTKYVCCYDMYSTIGPLLDYTA